MDLSKRFAENRRKWLFAVFALISFMGFSGCAPQVTQTTPLIGQPGSIVSLSMVNLVGWPRVEIASEMMDWPKLKLLSADPAKKDVRGEDLVWIEDKILQFRIPYLQPGDYKVTIHDDKGPPGDPVYAFLETAAYLVFPPVWPYVLRSNKTEVNLRIVPAQ